jgi:glycosyltransferase involved in cell wall biosynthesis
MDCPLSINLIICTYNNAALLDRALAAIARQKVSCTVDWQVLVVNNNSTDETVAIVDKYIQSEQLSLRIVSEPIQGLTPARLCGVKNTTGDWIAFVDDDCLLTEDWVEQAAKFALAHPECGAFGGRVSLDWETLPTPFILNYGWCFAEQEYGENPQKMSCLVGAGLVINRTALSDIGWVEKQFLQDRVGTKLISGGDVEIGLRLAAVYDLWYHPACQLQHFIPTKRTSEQYLKNMNYNLGISKLLGDTMLWHGTYATWLWVSTAQGIKDSVVLFMAALKVAISQKSMAEVALNWSFIQGWWAGVWKLLSMNANERKELLGCARHRHLSQISNKQLICQSNTDN